MKSTSVDAPIDWSLISDGPTSVGAEVAAIGYPDAVSVIGRLQRSEAQVYWASSSVSLPVVSFGHIAMMHEALPFFWADVSIYPRSSGGALVENDQLVGIVSAQATVPTEGVDNASARVPFARVMRSGLLRELLTTQLQKDALHSEAQSRRSG